MLQQNADGLALQLETISPVSYGRLLVSQAFSNTAFGPARTAVFCLQAVHFIFLGYFRRLGNLSRLVCDWPLHFAIHY